MIIKFEGPQFYNMADEGIFFESIQKLPAYKRISGMGVELCIELTDNPDQESIELLIVIFIRWGIDVGYLTSLSRLSESQKPWVNEALKTQ